MQEYVLDVAGKSLGRAASEAASILRGKHLPSFQPNALPDLRLRVVNYGKIRITGATPATKRYQRYSGYPGGRKETELWRMFAKNPGWVFLHALRGMLPASRLRQIALRRITIEQ